MKCKYCQAELEEGILICPACGKEQEAETELQNPVEETAEEVITEEVETEAVAAEAEPAQIKEGVKATPGKIALAIAAGVVVLALLVALVVSGIDGDIFKKSETAADPTNATVSTDAVETVTEGTIPPDGNPDDVTCKGSYSVTDEELNAAVDTVVAKLGDEELTIAELQVYYWEAIYAFANNYGTYAAQLGLDPTGSMDRQLCAVGDISMTWQQYFLDYALNTWHTHTAVALAGKDAGYELEEIYQEELDNLPIQIAEMISYYGLTSEEEWIREYLGPGCTVADYMDYVKTYYLGYGYLDKVEKDMVFTADEVEAYYAANEELYAQNGLTKDAGKTYNVRHILLKPSENAETGEDGYPLYTEEEWTACEAKAQQMLDAWKANDATEDSFAALAMEKSEDPGSNYLGGLYENLTMETNFVPTFKEWYLDESRQVGDTGLVKSPHGYHIMYFSGSEDIWYATAEADLISEQVSAVLPAAKEKYAIEIDYSAIKLGVYSVAE